MAATIIRVIYEGTTYDLDIDGDIPLRLNVSTLEVGNVGEIFGVGSQTFTLPGNKNNNRFFNHAYDIGVNDVPGFYNSITGYIIYNGETVLRGQFYLLDVTRDEEGYVSYNCQITDDVVQLKDNLANQFIAQADWSEYDHTISSASIIESWDGNLLSGSVFYPVAEYGDEDEDTSLSRIGFSDGGAGNYFDKSSTPLLPQQLIPAIRVRDVLDTIINQVGFRATGSFFESEQFQNIYLLPKSNEGVGFTASSGSTAIAKVLAVQQDLDLQDVVAGPVAIPYALCDTDPLLLNRCYDPLNAFTTHYNMADIGNYEFEVNYAFFNPFSFGGVGLASATLEFNLMVGTYSVLSGTVIDSQEVFVQRTFGNPFQPPIEVQLGAKVYNTAPGTDVWLQVRATSSSNVTTERIVPFALFQYFQCILAPTSYEGSTVDMSLQFPSDLRSIDVVSGILQQFNLVMLPDYNSENVIEVATFDDWMLSGRNIDWTDKFESAERISITHTVDEVEREIIYTNEKDNDRFSKITIENEPGDQYGTLRVLADNNISQGKRTVKNNFAPVILASSFLYGSVDDEGNPTYNVDLNSRFAVPHLYKFENNRLKSFKFKPRIGYRVENTMPSGSSFFFGEGGSNTEITGSYVTLGNVEHLPVTASFTKDLLFNNTYTPFTSPALGLNNGKSNYENYWKLLTDSLYWDGSRKVTLDIKFKPQEYKDLRLNDHIFIKDQQYRINKISGFNLTDSDVVTVELLKLYPAYFTPTLDLDELCAFEVSGSYEQDGVCATPVPTATPTPTPTYPPGVPTPTPAPTIGPTPAPAPDSLWRFVAGKQPDAANYGFHRGSLTGCPSNIGYGTTDQVTQALPGIDCYGFSCLGQVTALASKGYGILSNTGNSSGLVLTQFQWSGGLGTPTFFIAVMNEDGTNIGEQILNGNIVGNNGTSATFSVLTQTITGYVDDSCNGTQINPESLGFFTPTGINNLVEGVTYTITLN